MTTVRLASPDDPDPRHWLPEIRTGCLLLAGMLLLGLGLSLLCHMCSGAVSD